MNVVFYGARQAQWLCWIYRSLARTEEGASFIEASPRPAPAHEKALADADLIAVQFNGTSLPAAFEGFSAERALFPELAVDFLWPFGGQPHARNTRDAIFPEGPFPVELGDAWLNRRLGGRQMAQAIEAEYLALDIAGILDLDRYKLLALERQGEIDRGCGEDFATRIEAGFRAAPLLANPTTPGGDLMRDLANRLFKKMRAPFALAQDWRSEVSLPELPVHPSVARHFQLSWTAGRRYRAWAGEAVDFPEYLIRYLAYAEGAELESGIKLAADGQSQAALPLLKTALARPLGRRSLTGRRALARAYVADPASGEAAAALQRAGCSGDAPLLEAAGLYATGRWDEAERAARASAKTATSPDAQSFLALVCERRGDHAGRIAALRAALTMQPGDVSLQSRLTIALSTSGDLAGAIASAEAEIALQPANPHSRAFLAMLCERAGDAARARAEVEKTLELIADRPEHAGLRRMLEERRAAAQQPT